MTDWDASLDDPPRGKSSLAFIGFAAWLLCLPFDLCARLRRGAEGDDGCEGADWGLETSHNGTGQ